MTPSQGMADRSYQSFSGWLDFAGTVIILIGGFNLIQGLVALLDDEYFVVTKDKILLFDFTAWGWILIVLGLFELLIGFCVLANKVWARVTGIVLAIVSIVTQLGFLAAFPIWSVLTISLGVLVIYALVVPPAKAAGEL
jgi:hypothetical protein